MAGIGTRLLDLGRVSVHDNFLKLGENSLLATQINSCLRDLFKVELPPTVFLERPTVAEPAESAEEAVACRAGAKAPGTAPLSRGWHSVEPSSREIGSPEHLSRGE